MSAAAVTANGLFFLRRHFSSGGSFAVLGSLGQQLGELARDNSTGSCSKGTSCWAPDPRTGIYSPKGQEGVMEDVPENAARFTHNIWVRSIDDSV